MKSWISSIICIFLIAPEFLLLATLISSNWGSIELVVEISVKYFSLLQFYLSSWDLPELKKVVMARIFSIKALLLFFTAILSFVSAWDINSQNDRHGCQGYSQDPLEGCDRERTIFVDVVSSESKYKTVQSGKNLNLPSKWIMNWHKAAVASLPNNTGKIRLD